MASPLTQRRDLIVGFDEPILVTGAAGFIGSRVVETLLRHGFRYIKCFIRPSGSRARLSQTVSQFPQARVELIEGNLLSRQDCLAAAKDVRLVYHVAAGFEKSFAGCVLNSVVSTRNLLESVHRTSDFKRFVNVSSFSVYSNFGLKRGALLDETCELETEHTWRHEPYAYAKLKQDEIVQEYAVTYNMPHVIVRPGVVYGPGNAQLTGRIGLRTFGIFMHLGGGNPIPFTHVDNCAAAIVLAGIVPGIDGETFNVVDDELPSSREFLNAYKKNVGALKYVRIPYPVFYLLCYLWERHCRWSGGQLPPVFNRRRCAAYWKGNRYSNRKLKQLLGWKPVVSFRDGLPPYFEYLKRVQAC